MGQKGRGARVRFERGHRPEGVIDHRYATAWIYAAVRPGTNEAFALVLPEVSAEWAVQSGRSATAAEPQQMHSIPRTPAGC